MPTKSKINVKEKVEDNVCDLSLSELKEVPVSEIASFKRVNVLDLSSNRLLTLGNNFTLLTRLVKLDLSKNKIKSLPDEFGVLRNLRHLNLYDNQLQYLPITFGDLNSLRYLDLKCNPLHTTLAKVVGPCLTNKDCQESARKTVNFMTQLKANSTKEDYVNIHQQQTLASLSKEINADKTSNDKAAGDIHKSKKSTKKYKSKKKANFDNQHQTSAIPTTIGTITTTTTTTTTTTLSSSTSASATALGNNNNLTISKTAKSKRSADGILKANTNSSRNHGTALSTLIIFLLLLGVNIVVIYMVMFKNPEIAEKLVEAIPHQYRNLIITKTEIFRLRVTDWISQFRTPPEEN
ncbi:uncharacterized protein ACN427_003807 [Glossina fuscipes fuscipes]